VYAEETDDARLTFVSGILANLSRLSQAGHEEISAATLTRARTCVAKLLETMKQCWDHLGRQYSPSADKELIPSYLEFCRNVRLSASELLLVPSVQDLAARLSWVPLAP
jgi:hypothetical protein